MASSSHDSESPAELTRGADLRHLAVLLNLALPLRPQLAELLLAEYGPVALWLFRATRARRPIRGEQWTQLPHRRHAERVSLEAICADLAAHLLDTPGATIGMTIPHGLLALDADPIPDGPDVATWLEAHAPLGAPVQKSPRGTHVVLRYPPGARIRTASFKTGAKAELLPGYPVDVRSGHPESKGCLMVWPSRGREARPYSWLCGWPLDREDIPQIPADWLAALQPDAPGRAVRQGLERSGFVWERGPILEGAPGRDVTLFRLACCLQHRGWSLDRVTSTLLGVNAEWCRPPLPERVVLQKVTSAARYRAAR